ncbi:MAG: general secretion pathway protein GspK [Verrucomicrobiae bacterium]|nr:general secretion pathway protein GspK [Verrucomicrobiae bacterium]
MNGPSCHPGKAGGGGRGAGPRTRERGAVLVIVLWVAFGLVSLTLYFAHSMGMELRAADHRSSGLAAEQAIAGAARYVTNVLHLATVSGRLPDRWSYRAEAVPVGEATFWLIGRGDASDGANRLYFELVDESSRLNLNAASIEVLQWLPRMTPELAAAIVDWRDTDSEPSPGGAEDEVYLRLNPPYRCKNGPFESVEELRLVHGMDLEILFGEDTNWNGVLDANENDGEASPPFDNRDGRLDPGLIEYVTVSSREPAMTPTGTARLDLSADGIDEAAVGSLLQERFGTERGNEILARLGALAEGFGSVLQFYIRSGMTADELAQVEEDIRVAGPEGDWGKVNVNTASETVLACLPGIGPENAPTLVAHRRSLNLDVPTLAWVTEVLGEEDAIRAGPYLTGRSYQFSADIAAVGPYGRGYRRERWVFDTEGGTVRMVARRDLTHLGWALGPETRRELLLTGGAR